MRTFNVVLLSLVAGVLFSTGVSVARADDAAAPRVKVILAARSYWRSHVTVASEMIRLETGKVVPLEAAFRKLWRGFKKRKELVEAKTSHTPLPADNWRRADFDDGDWVRLRGPVPSGDRSLGMMCLRGRFNVTDPKTAGDMKLLITYRGGAVAYVNGTEVGRGHLPKGETAAVADAEPYPKDAYVDPDGFVLRHGFRDPSRYKDRFALRNRTLTATVPAALLRKGVNVLAIEIHRAPTDDVLLTGKPRRHGKNYCWWSMMSLRKVELTATGDGVEANVARPKGMRLFNQPVVRSVYKADYGDPCEPLRPVAILGSRGGVHSGQIVLSTTESLTGLKVAVTDLKHAGQGAVIPATAIQLRHGVPGGAAGRGAASRYGRGITRFGGLLDGVPASVDVPEGADGVTMPIWLTVRIPREAKAGAYRGAVTVSHGAVSMTVPIELKVHDWLVPDSRQFTSHVGLVQSPWSLALRYKVPLWSKKHWALIEKSFELLGQVGDKVLFIPILRRTHLGNEHSMVRWIKQPDGSFKHDFSLVEKYVAIAAKRLGRIPVVCLYVWEMYTGSSYLGHSEKAGKGMLYTLLGPDGKLTEAEGPRWGDPATAGFWKPVIDGIREVLAKHDLAGSMMFGVAGDSRPTKSAVDDLRAVAPKVPWVVHSHATAKHLHKQPVGYLADVWAAPSAPDPDKKRVYGWQNRQLRVTFPRAGSNTVGTIRTSTSPARYRLALEGMQSAGIHGFGRMGADFWSLIPGRHHRKWPVLGRFPISGWAQLTLRNSSAYVLWPGPDGPVATVRFEMIREGAQECEAKIFIEKVLTDAAGRATLGDELAGRCERLLNERIRYLSRTRNGALPNWIHYLGVGFTERSARLFALAGEVAAALGK